MSIKPLLTEVFKTIDPFMKNMEFLIFYRTETGDLTFSSRNKDGRYLKITPKADYPIEGNACLGKLSYLKTMLDSSFMKLEGSEVTFEYGLASDKRTNVVKTITCKSSRAKSVYQTMDPLLNQAVMGAMKSLPSLNLPVQFPLDKEMQKNFSEALKVIKAYESPDLVRLEVEGGTLGALFDIRGDSSAVQLRTDLQAPNLSARFAVEQVDTLLKLGASYESQIGLSDKMIRLSFSLEHADYMFIVASKKAAS